MIRLAGISDTGGIRKLMSSIDGFWDKAWRSDVVERAIACAEAIAVVHVDGKTIDGFACAHDAGFRAYLSELVVSPSAQGKGIGGRLLKEIEQRLAGRGCSIVIADVWREAEPFYQSHGWMPPPVVLLRKRIDERAAHPEHA